MIASPWLWDLLALAIVILAYTYVGYPLLVGALGVLARRRVRSSEILPPVSIVVLAHDEERDIGAKLENSLALDYPRDRLEIVVASDGSTDRTDEIVAGFGPRGVRLFRAEDHPGKTETTNRVVPTTRGEILVFSDATGLYTPGAIRALVRNFADPEVGAVTGRVQYRYGRSAPARGFRTYQRFVIFARRAESRFGTETSVSGSICAIRRELFRAVPPFIDFDLSHPLHVAQAGRRTVYEWEAVSEERAREDLRLEFAARVRMAILAFSFLPYLIPRLGSCRDRLYVFQVLSHKLLRWLSPFFLLVVLATCALLAPGSPLAFGLLMVQITGYLAALTGYSLHRRGREPQALGVPMFFVAVNLAFLVGFFRWIAGERLHAWSTRR